MMGKAFTLIEMLVVLAIIIALAAMMIPLVSGTNKFMDEESNKKLMTIVRGGLDVYFSEYGQYPLQANWAPEKNNGIYHTPDGGMYTDTNNLAKLLAAKTPAKPTDAADLENIRFKTGFESDDLFGKLPKEISSQFDYSQAVVPIIDYYGNPLVYIYNPLGIYDGNEWVAGRGRMDVEKAAEAEGKEVGEYSAFTHAFSKYRIRYQLWSRGEDGLFDEKLYDADNIVNQDNFRGVE